MPVKVDERGVVIRDPAHRAHRWRLNVPPSVTGGKKRRLFFQTEKEAKAKREELLQHRAGLSGHALDQLATRGMTVEDAIAFAVAHAPHTNITVGVLAEEFKKYRAQHLGVGARYLGNLSGYLQRICAAFGEDSLAEVNERRVVAFLGELRGRDGVSLAAPDTRNRYREVFVALANFAVKRGYLTRSPLLNVQRVISDEQDVEILSVEEAEKLLRVLERPEHAEVAPAAMIQLFAGVRRAEIPHLRWELLGEKYLRLDQVKRGTRKRPVEFPAMLLSWLAPARKQEGYIFAPAGVDADRECKHLSEPAEKKQTIALALRRLEDAFTVRLNRAAKAAGLELPKNVLRHTGITMRLNHTGDLAATARWSGNTPAVLEEHYLGVCSPDDAGRFYALKPTPAT